MEENKKIKTEKDENNININVVVNNNIENKNIQAVAEKDEKKQEIIRFFKFLFFSLSAGIIQLGSFELLYHVIGWNNWWATYLISITLSVIWNFTFNR